MRYEKEKMSKKYVEKNWKEYNRKLVKKEEHTFHKILSNHGKRN